MALDRYHKFRVRKDGGNRGTKGRINEAGSGTGVPPILIVLTVNDSLLKNIMVC